MIVLFRRLTQMLMILAALSFVLFGLLSAMPGDPVDMLITSNPRIKPEDVVRLTIYVTDLDAYRMGIREIGQTYRQHLGKHFPAMALVGVSGLVEPRAVVEIEATAVLGNGGNDPSGPS